MYVAGKKLLVGSVVSWGFLLGFTMLPAAEIPQPTPGIDGVKISLFAAEPEIVTPIGATIDSQGRLVVVESQSHFRPKNYQGPATDRIRMFQDTKGTGHADKVTTLYEGTNFMMNVAGDRDGSLVVTSRNEVFRLTESPDHGLMQKTTLAKLQTESSYPHNGIHSIGIAADGSIYFGMGENLGLPWVLTGTDGRKLTDEHGNGAIYHMDAKGGGLVQVCHGFWNPFGLGIDPWGDVWTVDNDPDGRPPCRLVQVLPGADYGYQFRYGRTGLHPLQGWDGELPGTLGMIAGVGEAPCAVMWCRDGLLVTSWRDHVVEEFVLKPKGASWSPTRRVIASGGEDFRPVGLAMARDGSVFVTDWASKSYPVHGKGRIWKITFDKPVAEKVDLKPTQAMEHAAQLRNATDVHELVAALDDVDPVTRQAAEYGLSKLPEAEKVDWASLKSPRQRIGLLAALLIRRQGYQGYLDSALQDPDDRVRQMAVRVIAWFDAKEFRPQLAQLLESQTLSSRLLSMTIAASSQLDGDKAAKINPKQISSVLMARLNAPHATDENKAVALQMMLPTHPHIAVDQIAGLLESPSAKLQRQAIRYLDDDLDPARFAVLAKVAGDAKYPSDLRAEAIVGLADDAPAEAELLLKLAGGEDAALRSEALRSLRPLTPKLTESQKQQLGQIARQYPADGDLVARVLGQPVPTRPEAADMSAWQKIVDQQPGDPEAGRRIFFHPNAAGCYRCHTIEGRGRAVGPDLTMIGHSQTREHVLESILLPSKEIAPLFTYWSIVKKDGTVVDGVLLRRDGQSNEVYCDASGKETTVKEPDVADRRIRKESLMPDGLVAALTDQELRDLLAFLTLKR
jgi:hypothetical protein